MATRQEGYACSFARLGSLVGAMKVTLLHSQHGNSIGENMSPKSVLDHRALSGLAIAIGLEEKKKNRPWHAQDHVVFSRYCCKENISHISVGQEANSQHALILSSSFSRERLVHMIHKERETASDAPIVGLRMVASLYPMIHLNNPEAKRHENLVMGRSVSRERIYMEVMQCDERKQGNVCERGVKVSMLISPPLQKVKSVQPDTCKSEESRGFLAGRSTEEPIFYYVNPSSSDTSPIATDDDLSCSPMENFLKICVSCKCHLGAGKDIYMYRGDQAFCSAECRYQQIMIDECIGSTA